jgi:phenylacetate-CoA ligase
MSRLLRAPLWRIWQSVTGHAGQLKLLEQLLGLQLLSETEVNELYIERIRALLSHVVNSVPYYQSILQGEGRSLDSIMKEPLETLGSMPLLTKSLIRERFDDLKSNDLPTRSWLYNMTGGSTGEPVRFIKDVDYSNYNLANKALFDRWSGHRPGQPKIVLWGSERDLHVGSETLKTRIGHLLRNDHWFNTFRMSEGDMRVYVERINAIRPVQILAYVESAYELACFIERDKRKVYSPKSVMTSAGTLQPHMRSKIERVFQAPVFNRYGSREVGDIACECERHQGLHINPFTHYVEIIRPDGTACAPGETGEVVVTLLTNFAMPFIRYQIGDLAAWAERACECGCRWPLLESVSGRVNSIIRTTGGTLDSVALSSLLYFMDSEKTIPFTSFSRYQLVQVERDHLTFRVLVEEKDPDLWEVEKHVVEDKLRHAFGESVRIDIEKVSYMEPGPSGKHQYIWSEVV